MTDWMHLSKASAGTLTRALLAALGALVVGFGAASLASAAPYQYRDIDWVGQQVSPDNPEVSGVLDLVNVEGDCILFICDVGGFVPGTAVGGRVSFVLVGSDLLETDVEIELDGLLPDFDSYNLWIFEIETAQIAGELLAALNLDGQLAWTIRGAFDGLTTASAEHVNGDHRCCFGCDHDKDGFYVKVAKLEAAIPEPGAAILFAIGSGVVGTGVRRRRTA